MDKLETQRPWSNGNAIVVARARADVLAHSALIFRAHAKLEDALAAPATPVRQFLIEVARSRLAEQMATTSTVALTPPPSALGAISTNRSQTKQTRKSKCIADREYTYLITDCPKDDCKQRNYKT